jgi:hypothetical protein
MNEKLSNILNNRWTPTIGIALLAFGAGVGVGHILSRRPRRSLHVVPEIGPVDLPSDEVQKIIDKDLEELRPKPVVVDEDYIRSRSQEPEDVEEPELVTSNVFANNGDSWNYDEEVKARNPELPYILHKDEFYDEERGYVQHTLTFYEGDNVLVDEEDAPIYNYERVTGPLKFGHGSGDPNVVYIRNDKQRAEYEIIKDEGYFSVEVLGIDPPNERVRQPKHPDKDLQSD